MNSTATKYPAARDDLTCPEPECDAPMKLKTLRFGPAYCCTAYPGCSGIHGAHPDGSPKGTPADRWTRKARIRTHDVFDPLWKDAPRMYVIREDDPVGYDRAVKRIRGAARGRTYRYVADRLGMDEADVHIGGADLELCARIIRVCVETSPEEIRAWAKSNGRKTQPETKETTCQT